MNGDDRARRIQHVDVERDVDRGGALERRADRLGAEPHARHADELLLGRVERRGRRRARRRRGSTVSESMIMRSGMPHSLPLGEVAGVFRSPCASNQTTAAARGAPRAPSTAPMWEQQQPPRTSGRSGSAAASARVWRAQRVLARRPRPPGYGSGSMRRGLHRLAAVPQARGTRMSPAAEASSAGMALVAILDRDRGQGSAVRAARPQPRHRSETTRETSASSVSARPLRSVELRRARLGRSPRRAG